jgi:AraC-like DNA-binding protein
VGQPFCCHTHEIMLARMVRSWRVSEISHLECFRAVGLIHEYGRHSHPAWAIGVIDEGIGGIGYRGSSERIGPGELIAINPDEVHTGYAVQRDGVSYRMLYIGHELVKDSVPAAVGTPAFPEVRIQDPILGLRLRRLCRSLELPLPCLIIESHLLTILGALFMRHTRMDAGHQTGRESRHVALIQEYLRANLRRNVRLNELANLTGLSKAHVIRSFHRLVGMPPYEWLLQLRIEEARNCLQKGVPIAELATELGFADQSHFHRRFKLITDMTPAVYAEGHYRSRQGNRPPR